MNFMRNLLPEIYYQHPLPLAHHILLLHSDFVAEFREMNPNMAIAIHLDRATKAAGLYW
jgi:hypothetical protein